MSTSAPTQHTGFDEEHVLHVLKHFLPSQGPLKDFVHHNTLHAFQDMNFYDAIFKASKIFGYQTTFTIHEYRNLYKIERIRHDILEKMIVERKGKEQLKEWTTKVLEGEYDIIIEPRVGKLRQEWRKMYPIDLNNSVQPLLFRIIGSYLDQGIAISPFPFEQKGLLSALREIDKHSYIDFFKTQRAKDLLHDESTSLTSLLNILVGREELYEEYLYDQQFAHRGWSGMVATVEDRPETLMYAKSVNLKDFIILELLLEIDALEYTIGTGWKPLGEKTSYIPTDLFADVPKTELQEVLMIWQDAFEWSYYDTVIVGLEKSSEHRVLPTTPEKKTFQAIFCIDEREGSLRRYVESLDDHCETLGAPGFFGVEFYFHSAYAKFYDKLCPAPVTPKYLIREIPEHDEHARPTEATYAKHSHTLLRGFFSSYLMGIPSIGKLLWNLINPTMSPAIADAFSHMDAHGTLTIVHQGERDEERDLQVGFTVTEMTDRVEKLLRGIGMVKDFADLVYIVAHGSSSANNPHHGAHDCGACSGRPGATNARVFAFMANYQPVRDELVTRGLVIPAETQFISVLHDTASDLNAYYDEEILSTTNKIEHARNKELFESALDLNAKERSRRFMSISTTDNLKNIRKAIQKRSVSYFEPRPELGHGTNALCIVGARDMTKDLFLDRRAFFNSYDYRTDPDGKYLTSVIMPLPVVCGGINLEYYFSRMDNYKLGAGTKLPHNVMGLIGVSNSSDGDLRPGLPLQMIEVHDPVRLLMVVEHDPEVVRTVISSTPALYEWFINEWVHLVVFHPVEKKFYVFKKGVFISYTPLTKEIAIVDDVPQMLESVEKMKSNYILDATKENISVLLLKK